MGEKVSRRLVLLMWIVGAVVASADGLPKRSSRKPIVFLRLRANGKFGLTREAYPEHAFSAHGVSVAGVPEVHSPLYESDATGSGSLRSGLVNPKVDYDTTSQSVAIESPDLLIMLDFVGSSTDQSAVETVDQSVSTGSGSLVDPKANVDVPNQSTSIDSLDLTRSSTSTSSLTGKPAIPTVEDNAIPELNDDVNSPSGQSNRNSDSLVIQTSGGSSSGVVVDSLSRQSSGSNKPLPNPLVTATFRSSNSVSSSASAKPRRLPMIFNGVCENPNEGREKFTIDTSEAACKKFVSVITPELKRRVSAKAKASWHLKTNETEHNLNVYKDAHDNHASFLRGIAKTLRRFDKTNFKDKDFKRSVRRLRKCGYSALQCDSFQTLEQSIAGMKANYARARVCKYGKDGECDLPLHPHVETIMASSRDPEELKHYWTQWHQAAGRPSKQIFDKYVLFGSKAASLNGFPSMADYWLDAYEHRRFKEEMSIAMDKIAALYLQLHAYVRYKIRQTYGEKIQEKYGPIQMNLLGDMSGQNWENVASFATPYPEYRPLDVSEEMLVQRHTPKKMLELADEFLQSLNMSAMPNSFYENCAVKQNESCEPSVHDMFNSGDVRIKMCPKVNHHDLFSVHNLVAQAQYSILYQNQPTIYRKPACPGFQDAFGQLISLSASSPRNLERTRLLCSYQNTPERKVNRLFLTALQKLPQLPFIYSVEKFRLKAFRHTIHKENYNCRFWQLRSKYAGVEPPVNRTSEDFDPAALYQVSSDTESIQQFFSTVAQFQMHKALCRLPGEHRCKNRSELSDCNIADSKQAGKVLKRVLREGSSKPWTELMEQLTGYKGLNAGPMVDYFYPLYEWLVQHNQKNRVPLGWSESTRCPCKSQNEDDDA